MVSVIFGLDQTGRERCIALETVLLCIVSNLPSSSGLARNLGEEEQHVVKILAVWNAKVCGTTAFHAFSVRGQPWALSIKGRILIVDLSHELRAKFNCLFELLFGLAL
jgi:hypothetical protein